ncbi:mitochondrial MRS2-like protein [Scheffersomyces coipomensis]|uniref:mitochondrial MRS2-like protein n=1 Tax=Scheffersomyces coipomensis TaxID=1788519 RepID=UPI00315DA913
MSTKLGDAEVIRCTIFNGDGEMISYGKDMKKSEFMKVYNLAARDFRKITRHQNTNNNTTNINIEIVPSIVTRADSILLNLLHIRALIKHDTVVVFDNVRSSTGGSRLNKSHSHSIFLNDLRDRLKAKDSESLPYELRALETILVHVMSNLTTEMKVHKTVLQNILQGLEDSIERVKLRYLLIQSKKLAQFNQKAVLIRDLIDDLLEQDDELNSLYLSDSHKGLEREGNNHEEVELLLESYYKTSDEIVQTVGNLRSQIRTTEEIINIILDSNRNEMMLLGLKFSIGLLSLGIALYVSALYGMNLENFIEESDGGFELICLISVIGLLILLRFSMKQLNKAEKVTMTRVSNEDRIRKIIERKF